MLLVSEFSLYPSLESTYDTCTPNGTQQLESNSRVKRDSQISLYWLVTRRRLYIIMEELEQIKPKDWEIDVSSFMYFSRLFSGFCLFYRKLLRYRDALDKSLRKKGPCQVVRSYMMQHERNRT